MDWEIGILILVGLIVAGAVIFAATRPRNNGVRTLANPAEYGMETVAHRNEIGAPNAPVAGGESIVDGWRVSGPTGTFSGERWSNRPALQSPRELGREGPEWGVLRKGQQEVVSPQEPSTVNVVMNNGAPPPEDPDTTEGKARRR